MAVVHDLLFRNECSGQLAHTIVAYMMRGQQCVRQYVVPHDPRTPLQLAQRSRMAQATADYHQIISPASWIPPQPNTFTQIRDSWAQLRTLLRRQCTGFNLAVQALMFMKTLQPHSLFVTSGFRTAPGTARFYCAFPGGGPVVPEPGTFHGSFAQSLDGPWVSASTTAYTWPWGPTLEFATGLFPPTFAIITKDTYRSGVIDLREHP